MFYLTNIYNLENDNDSTISLTIPSILCNSI